jgi:hypothetical protein
MKLRRGGGVSYGYNYEQMRVYVMSDVRKAGDEVREGKIVG